MVLLIVILLSECIYVNYFILANKEENTANQIPCVLQRKKKKRKKKRRQALVRALSSGLSVLWQITFNL